MARGGNKSSGETLVAAIRRKLLGEIPIWLPAKVTAYKAPGTVQTPVGPFQREARVDCEVQLLTVNKVNVAEDAPPGAKIRHVGGRIESRERYPIAINVPVAGLGPRGLRTRGPIEVGELGILLLSTRGIERWLDSMSEITGEPQDPVLGFGLRMTAACFIPGIEVGASEAADYPSTLAIGDHAGLGAIEYDALGGWYVRGLTVALGDAGAAQALAFTAGAQAALGALAANPAFDPAQQAAFTAAQGLITGTTQTTAS